MVILLDLERLVALELPSHELRHVRTVADLSQRLRGWLAGSALDVRGAAATERANLAARAATAANSA